MLVIIGADEWGNKDVPGLIDGFRESTQSGRELLLDLNRRSAKRNAGGWRHHPSWRLGWGHGVLGRSARGLRRDPGPTLPGAQLRA